MSKINNGGTAFPTSGGGQGMSLRDYFAAAAITGIATSVGYTPDYKAKMAYEMADAMIAARGESK